MAATKRFVVSFHDFTDPPPDAKARAVRVLSAIPSAKVDDLGATFAVRVDGEFEARLRGAVDALPAWDLDEDSEGVMPVTRYAVG